MTLNKNSWHFWLVTTLTNGKWVYRGSGDNTFDFCQYTRYVIWGIIKAVFYLLCWLFVLGMISIAAQQVVIKLGFNHGFVLNSIVGLLGFVVGGTSLLGIVGSGMVGYAYIVEKINTTYILHEPKSDSFLSSAYQSFKNKVCFTFKFKE